MKQIIVVLRLKKIISGILSVIFFTLVGCQTSPQDVVKNFYKLVEKGKFSQAKEYLSKDLISKFDDFKLTMVLENESQEILECKGIKDIKVDVKGEGELRLADVEIVFNGDCDVKTETVKLILENDEWKITMSK